MCEFFCAIIGGIIVGENETNEIYVKEGIGNENEGIYGSRKEEV